LLNPALGLISRAEYVCTLICLVDRTLVSGASLGALQHQDDPDGPPSTATTWEKQDLCKVLPGSQTYGRGELMFHF
jgi:hypothetical protein